MSLSSICFLANDALLAEEVLGHFRRAGEYLAVFDIINAPLPQEGTLGDKWLDNELTHISNAINHLNPSKVVLLRCPKTIIDRVNSSVSPEKIIQIESFNIEILSRLPGFKRKRYPVKNHKLESGQRSPGNIVVVEDNPNNRMSEVIAYNLAIFDNAKVAIVPQAGRKDVESIEEIFREWMSSNDSLIRDNCKQNIIDMINLRLGDYQLNEAATITFITRGIPYGFYPFDFPTTHFYSHRFVGVQIICGILKTTSKYLHATSAFICDPGELDHTESEVVCNLFRKTGYLIKKLYARNATVNNVYYSSENLPFDYIYFSTHCGEVSGYIITEQFKAQDGTFHEAKYERVVSFMPEKFSDMIQVTKFYKWISIDGVDWKDKEGKEKIGAGDLIESFYQYTHARSVDQEKKDLIDATECGVVKGSNALKMYDSNFMPTYWQIGGYMYPVVFNNACSTWHEIAIRCAFACCSAYIGTSIDIPNPIATDVAKKFTRRVLRGRTVAFSLFDAQKDYIKQYNYTPYLLYGYIFTSPKIVSPRKSIRNVFFKRLSYSIDHWKSYISETSDEEPRNNAERILKFLINEKNEFIDWLKNKKGNKHP